LIGAAIIPRSTDAQSAAQICYPRSHARARRGHAQRRDEFVWHKHDETDDFFLVLKGKLDIQLRDRTISLGPGEMYVVPKGVEHRPVAKEEVHLLLIEPTGTPNTGDKKTAAPRKPA
jgi:mannose-6-phosphate isomerase-like protein (cupin superfamily)